MKKNLAKILSAAVLSAGLLFAPVKKAESLEFYLYNGINFDGWIPSSSMEYNFEAQNIPEYIRDVPVHPDDSSYSANAAPIPDTKLVLPLKILHPFLEYKMGIGFNEGVFDFRIGPEISLFTNATSDSNSGIKERNYTNAVGTEERGYGAALTYYKLSPNSSFFNFGASAEASLSFNMGGNTFVGPFAEYSFLWLGPFSIDNGWDRWNKMEKKDSYELAAGVINHSIEAGLRFSIGPDSSTGGFADIYAGMSIPQIIGRTSLGDEVNFTFNPSYNFSVGVRIGGNINFLEIK